MQIIEDKGRNYRRLDIVFEDSSSISYFFFAKHIYQLYVKGNVSEGEVVVYYKGGRWHTKKGNKTEEK